MQTNYIAIAVAALVPMALGFLWYNPKVFGTVWMKQAGMTEEKIKSGNMLLIYGLSFLLSFMLAFVMNVISYHDAFAYGSLYYVTPNHSMQPDPASDAGKWIDYYATHLSHTTRTFKHGAFHGLFIAGVFIALPIMGTNALFERKEFKYVAVNVGYWLICLALMGGIVAAWK